MTLTKRGSQELIKVLSGLRTQNSKSIISYYIGTNSIEEIASLINKPSEWVEFNLKYHEVSCDNLESREKRHKSNRYVIVSGPDGIRISEHKLIWEKSHGRSLPHGWMIHHLNGIKYDNRPENLLAMSRGEHCPQTTGLMIVTKDRIIELEKEVKELEGLVSAYEEYISSIKMERGTQ